MTLPKVFVTRAIPQPGLDILQKVAAVDVWEGELPPPYETIIERGRGAQGLLTLLSDRIDGALMDAIGPQLKVIAQYAVGFDNIDIAAATARGIPVGNTPGVLTETTADFAWALLMAAGRRVAEGDRFTRAGHWKTWGPSILLGRDVFGATLGIIGFGRIGQAVARRARGFNMRILYYDTTRNKAAEAELGAKYASFEKVLSEADYLTLHTALSAETRHLIGYSQFALMKSTAVLVNTSRGPVVDEVGPIPRSLDRADRRRRPGCDGDRAAAAGQPAAPPGKCDPGAAYRQRERTIAHQDGHHGSGEYRRRAGRQEAPNLRQPGSILRNFASGRGVRT